MILRVFSLFILFFGLTQHHVSAQTEAELWDIFDDNPFAKKTNHFGDTAYLPQWLKVDSLEKYNYLKQADSVVKNIYTQAWAEKKYPSVIKALIFQLKYDKVLKETTVWNTVQRLEDEITKLPSPHKNVLQSITANAWCILLNLSEANDYDESNIIPDSTLPSYWDKKKIIDKE